MRLGEGGMSPNASVEGKFHRGTVIRRIPVLSWDQIGRGGDGIRRTGRGVPRGWVHTTKCVGAGAFALWVRQPTLAPDCHQGSAIVVDPGREPHDGSLVLVRCRQDEDASVKRLVLIGRRRLLESLDTRFPAIRVSDCENLLGVVLQLIVECD